LREIDLTPVFIQSVLILMFPAAIAVFAAARAAALQAGVYTHVREFVMQRGTWLSQLRKVPAS
jgi:hypothetical protein